MIKKRSIEKIHVVEGKNEPNNEVSNSKSYSIRTVNGHKEKRGKDVKRSRCLFFYSFVIVVLGRLPQVTQF